MHCNKLIILIFAFFALILATVQANPGSSEEDQQISDRRFRWVGSNRASADENQPISDRRYRWEGSDESTERANDAPRRGNDVSRFEIIEEEEWVPTNEN